MRKLGISLTEIANSKAPDPCACPTPKLPLQPHHDHILDLAHDLLLDGLPPSKTGLTGDVRFGVWCQERGQAFYDELTVAVTVGGHKVVRFQPVLFCNSCHPKDGHGKATVQYDGVRWYSMTTAQLRDVAAIPSRWQFHYANDEPALVERVAHVKELVEAEIRSQASR